MKYCPLMVCVAATCLQVKAAEPDTIREGKILYASSVLSLSQSALQRQGEDLRRDTTVTLGVHRFYASPRVRRIASPPPTTDHCNYGLWRSLLQNFPEYGQCPATSEIVKIGRNVGVRTVSADCRVTSQMIGNSHNPLMILIGRRAYDIAWIYAYSHSKYSSFPVIPAVFVRTNGDVSVGEARTILEHLISITKLAYLSVELRSDNMFFGSCEFPIRYPFDLTFRIPTEQEFRGGRSSHCTSFGVGPNAISCLNF